MLAEVVQARTAKKEAPLFALLLLLTVLPTVLEAFCLIGNPEWRGQPSLEAIKDGISVNWSGIVYNAKGSGRDCTDNFRVKWWPSKSPNDYHLSDLLDKQQRLYRIEALQPNTNYGVQVIAREDKGSLGIDYNRSPTVYLHLKTEESVPVTPSENATKEAEVIIEELQAKLKFLRKLLPQVHWKKAEKSGNLPEDAVVFSERSEDD